MRLSDEDRRDIQYGNAVARATGWRVGLWVIAVIAAVVLLSAGGWALKVALSGPKGAGDVKRQTNSSTNRIFAQQHFQDLYNEIQAYDQQLDQAAADKAANPGDRYFAVNYSGLVKQCIDARAQYNADANKVTQAQWRDADLPQQVDASAPQTDCKEQTK